MAKDFRTYTNYPIGFRNNNPGNIRTGQSWQGATGSQNGFVTFKNMAYGIRAAATVLINNISSQGNDTIEKLITKYAPPSENNTEAYINAVSNQTGISRSQILTTDTATVIALLHAIFTHENGAWYVNKISDADISEGLALLSPVWLMKLQNFFVENPDAATAGAGVLVIIAIAVLIALSKKFKK